MNHTFNQIIGLSTFHQNVNENNASSSNIHNASEFETDMEIGEEKIINFELWSCVFEYLLICCCFLFILGVTLFGILKHQHLVKQSNHYRCILNQPNFIYVSYRKPVDNDFVIVPIFPLR